MIRLHGFDWQLYTDCVMPAIACWLIDQDESVICQLYERTRCAQEEHYVPYVMQRLTTWSRAQMFVRQLPRGSYACEEYHKLCDVEAFTLLSDRYVHRYPPQLPQQAEALRTIWGALIDEYCLPWSRSASDDALPGPPVDDATGENQGIIIGRHPMALHLRGWLARISIRPMVLFEYLACERRRMPFGYQAGDPYGSYIGYLKPEEIQQLADFLRFVELPDAGRAKEDYRRYLKQTMNGDITRMADEVLPMHAAAFQRAVQFAAQQDLALICSVG